MSPDLQEAESRKYSSGLMLLLLKSGRIAVFDREYQIITIVDSVNEIPIERAKPLPRKEPKPRAQINIDLGDLGL